MNIEKVHTIAPIVIYGVLNETSKFPIPIL